MRIALVFPPSPFLTRADVWPPLGLFYIAAQLEAQGCETDFFDLSMSMLPEDGEYDQLWISANSPQMFAVREIAKITEKWTKTKTVLGGAAPWSNPKTSLELPIDLVVVGEGDHPDTVRKVMFLAENPSNKLYIAPALKSLDWVLPPIRRWSKDYFAYIEDLEGREYRMTSLFTTRGCPMSCAFCESGRNGVIWGNSTRYEPIWIVEQQIEECRDLGFTGLAFYDDIFIINKSRTFKLLELTKKYGMAWRCFLRSDILCKQGGKEYLQAMKDAGLIEIFVGVESADNRIKRNIHKGTTIEQDTQVLQWCKELGIVCKMSFILGLPGESIASMQKTEDWILANRPHIVQVDRLIPFPGTPIYEHSDEYDLKFETIPEEEWFFRGKFDKDSRSFVSTSHLTVDQIDKFWHDLEITLFEEGLSRFAH